MSAVGGRSTYEAAELVPPGETLEDWLEREGMTQADFAKRTSLTPKHINSVVKGKSGISPEVALAFERVTSIPARYWAELDANYQTAVQRLAFEEDLRHHLDLVDRFPIKELVKREKIEHKATKLDQLKELLRFFGVADPEALLWLRSTLYRLSPAFDVDDAALASWLRLAELEAAAIKTSSYDAAKCRAAIGEMRALSALPGIDWLNPLRRMCASVGVALVVLKELPRCRVNGATRWLSPERAMIAMSLRHRRNDIFWFTFFHELCHVLRHSKKETFIDTNGSGIGEHLENEANSFAARILIPPELEARLRMLLTPEAVVDFARGLGVAPGIVVGRMQHDGLIPHRQWTELITRYRFADDP